MKKSILIFVLLLSNFTFSQDSLNVKLKSKVENMNFADKILKCSTIEFKLYKDTMIGNEHYLNYIPIDPSKKGVLFQFVSHDNLDTYIFRIALGEYDALFNGWKKYFQPNAEYGKTGYAKGDYDISFIKQADGKWQMSNQKQP